MNNYPHLKNDVELLKSKTRDDEIKNLKIKNQKSNGKTSL